jgi:hypothetical protein
MKSSIHYILRSVFAIIESWRCSGLDTRFFSPYFEKNDVYIFGWLNVVLDPLLGAIGCGAGLTRLDAIVYGWGTYCAGYWGLMQCRHGSLARRHRSWRRARKSYKSVVSWPRATPDHYLSLSFPSASIPSGGVPIFIFEFSNFDLIRIVWRPRYGVSLICLLRILLSMVLINCFCLVHILVLIMISQLYDWYDDYSLLGRFWITGL